MKPFSKLTGIIFSIAAIVEGVGHDKIVAYLSTFMSPTLAETIAVSTITICSIIGLFSHALNGTGGDIILPIEVDKNIKPSAASITTNLTTR